MGEEKLIDQSGLAESIAKKIKYDFLDNFLVKPLDVVKVTKEISVPVSEGAATKDKNGIEANDFSEVKTETKEVDSDYRRAVVLKTPTYYDKVDHESFNTSVKVGDIVIFRDSAGRYFDLFKDSKLIKLYDIIAIEHD